MSICLSKPAGYISREGSSRHIRLAQPDRTMVTRPSANPRQNQHRYPGHDVEQNHMRGSTSRLDNAFRATLVMSARCSQTILVYCRRHFESMFGSSITSARTCSEMGVSMGNAFLPHAARSKEESPACREPSRGWLIISAELP